MASTDPETAQPTVTPEQWRPASQNLPTTPATVIEVQGVDEDDPEWSERFVRLRDNLHTSEERTANEHWRSLYDGSLATLADHGPWRLISEPVSPYDTIAAE